MLKAASENLKSTLSVATAAECQWWLDVTCPRLERACMFGVVCMPHFLPDIVHDDSDEVRQRRRRPQRRATDA